MNGQWIGHDTWKMSKSPLFGGYEIGAPFGLERRGLARNGAALLPRGGAATAIGQGGKLAGIPVLIVAVVLTMVLPEVPRVSAESPRPPEVRELVIGTKVAPPFAIKAEDGSWHGISIDLWRRIADQIHLRYRFQETTLTGLTDGVAEGSLDAAVAALTVTGQRYRIVDFTQPYYSSGLGIAVPLDADISWESIVRNVFSIGFLRTAAVLFAISLSVGVVLWLIEHRHNEHFGAHRQGLGASVWWSVAAMTQAGGAAAGDKVPKTLPGRLLATLWMVTSVIVFVSLTAALTSQLTLKHLRGSVNGEADLRAARVGAIAGTETTEYLAREHIAYQVFADAETGLSALRKAKIDAFVYDRPLLRWLVNEHFSNSVRVLGGTFDPQAYAIALPQGSKLRMQINLALLDTIRSHWWRETLFEYLGPG
jgi:polar amino acid transport system substrate-binding protein